MFEFGVLGPLTVHRDHQPVALNAAMLRRLLALLLQRPGQPVSVACIVDTLWPDAPPATARKSIHVYVGRLRKALSDEDRIRHGPDGYTIVVAPDELDVTRFRTLLDAGRDAFRRGAPAEADHECGYGWPVVCSRVVRDPPRLHTARLPGVCTFVRDTEIRNSRQSPKALSGIRRSRQPLIS